MTGGADPKSIPNSVYTEKRKGKQRGAGGSGAAVASGGARRRWVVKSGSLEGGDLMGRGGGDGEGLAQPRRSKEAAAEQGACAAPTKR